MGSVDIVRDGLYHDITMTEYETASLALAQQGNLIALLVGLVQSGLIAWGLWLMRRASDHRDHLHAETMEQMAVAERAAERQHQATMDALRQQGEAFRQQNEAFHRQGEALRQQGEALRVLIERTAPSPA